MTAAGAISLRWIRSVWIFSDTQNVRAPTTKSINRLFMTVGWGRVCLCCRQAFCESGCSVCSVAWQQATMKPCGKTPSEYWASECLSQRALIQGPSVLGGSYPLRHRLIHIGLTYTQTIYQNTTTLGGKGGDLFIHYSSRKSIFTATKIEKWSSMIHISHADRTLQYCSLGLLQLNQSCQHEPGQVSSL